MENLLDVNDMRAQNKKHPIRRPRYQELGGTTQHFSRRCHLKASSTITVTVNVKEEEWGGGGGGVGFFHPILTPPP